jgi:hypothetical protein
VEVVVTTFIVMIVGLVIAGVIASANDFWKYSSAKLDAKSQSEIALQKIVGEMRNNMGALPLSAYGQSQSGGYISTQPGDFRTWSGPRDGIGFFPLTDMDGDGNLYSPATGALEYDPCHEVRYVLYQSPGWRDKEIWRHDFNSRINPTTCGAWTTTSTLLASNITGLRFIVNNDPSQGGCHWNPAVGLPPCPVAQEIQVEVTSNIWVMDKGRFRLVPQTVGTTLTLPHETIAPVVPLADTTPPPDAINLSPKWQEDPGVYIQYPDGTFPQ